VENGFKQPKIRGGMTRNNGSTFDVTLETAVRGLEKNWPTVTATEARQGFQDRSRGMKGQQESLTTVVVKSWPTPDVSDRRGPNSKQQGLSNSVKSGLADPDKLSSHGSRHGLFPTPSASDYISQPTSKSWKEKGSVNFKLSNPEIQQTWATPNAFCFQPPENTEQWQKRATMQQEKGVNLHKPVQSQVLHENEKVMGAMPPSSMKLNPRWVETLMGLPVGWVMPSCVNPITPRSEPSQSLGQRNWNTPNVMDTITPTRDLTKTPMKGHWGKSMNTGKLSEQVMQTNGGNWMTPEARNSTGYQVSNGKKILRLGSQVMETSTSPVTIEQTNFDSSETELFQQQQNSPSELFGRN
jgi:hypothetical protein